MKRFTLLAAALVMVLGMAVSASAAPEVSISGNLLVNAVWGSNFDFDDTNDDDASFNIKERADLYFTVTANENLKGVLGLRTDKGEWGSGAFALDTPGGSNGAKLNVRDAYIDFNWPGTDVNVKAGIYTVGLPAAVGGGSKIINERAGAVMVSTPMTDNVSVMAGWTRPYNNNTELVSTDAFVLAVPITFEGLAATPYAMYAYSGVTSNTAMMNLSYDTTGAGSNALELDDISAYWLGTDFTMSMFDPFILKADLAYGHADGKAHSASGVLAAIEGDDITASGWLFDLALDYTGFDFMTVEGFFAYTSGEDDDTEDSERMPVLNSDWALGSFFFGGGSITSDDINGGDDVMGFWTVGLSLLDIQSFAQGLTHTVHILYAQGTNDNDSYLAKQAGVGTQLLEDDSLWEVDFNTDYAIYDELTLYTQLGYINADFDEDEWGTDIDDDAWKVATGVVYKF
jgi:hypothetical protein